jgi:hypothetical protein
MQLCDVLDWFSQFQVGITLNVREQVSFGSSIKRCNSFVVLVHTIWLCFCLVSSFHYVTLVIIWL